MNIENAQDRSETRGQASCECVYRPNVDIVETPEELQLVADVPGSSSENINVNYENGTLSLYAKVDNRNSESTKYLRKEYGVGSYRREFLLNEDVAPDKITAAFNDGVLTIQIPKAEQKKPKRIDVRIN